MKPHCVKFFFCILSSIFLWNPANGQFRCGTKVTPEYVQFIRNYMLSAQAQRVVIPQVNKTLNITAWIVKKQDRTPSHDSLDIIDAIAGLDSFFNQMGISFTVCKVNLIDNWQFNNWDTDVHTSQAKVLYYQPNTINIYFMEEIANPAGAAGFAPRPPSDDYMVIKDPTTMVLAHEMGHFLGLLHTFDIDFGIELVNRTNCVTAGDLVCDTEADPDPSGELVDADCNFTGPPLRDSNGDFYEPPTDNIMSYYGSCRCRFTTEQYLRMAQMFASFRTNLW